jgi:hypothetical protein
VETRSSRLCIVFDFIVNSYCQTSYHIMISVHVFEALGMAFAKATNNTHRQLKVSPK